MLSVAAVVTSQQGGSCESGGGRMQLRAGSQACLKRHTRRHTRVRAHASLPAPGGDWGQGGKT